MPLSTVLNEAVVRALRCAYDAYMGLNRREFGYHIHVAESGIEAIGALGHDPGRQRELEVLFLTGEKTLMHAFVHIAQPRQLLSAYQLADHQLAGLPSRVLTGDMAFFPPGGELAALLRIDEQGAEEELAFSRAVELYGRLTGGGGAGAELVYSALLARRRGQRDMPADLLRRAGTAGGDWLKDHAERLLREIEQEDTL